MFIGVDVGTSSTKGVLVSADGALVASATREHEVLRPATGHVESDPAQWWNEFCDIARELTPQAEQPIEAVGVSGMGPCVLVTDENDEPLRPAILYGVDMRAVDQIEALNAELGAEEVLQRCGSALSTQAVGPKLRWIAEHEPEVWARTRRLYMPSSWLARQLTGVYVLDHHSASQAVPLHDTHTRDWYAPWCELIAPELELPELRWPGEVAGTITDEAAEATGLPAGINVITGTIDAWSEAISAGAHEVGDLMLMYGTTLFMINTVEDLITHPNLWGTVGALPDTRNLAAGMATSGAITSWLRGLFGKPEYADLVIEAGESPPGADGLLMLPYFAGERTPIADADARGTVLGLTVSHTRGDLYRAALEATAFGIRHNIETFTEAGATINRVVAVGGGTQGDLWTQIVSDVTGLDQVIPTETVGASLGAAFLAARTVSDVRIEDWNPPARTITPDERHRQTYDQRYALYRDLYPATVEINHALAATQTRTTE
ncbi:FGGY-family carbohydrate kinase [Propionibacteriaceae bacterium Y1700]|uniref:FGGY-family carbohydrate kinase n=1 Tax=Microlunatus sp. Y1700 TaxID=3418487 RepID=UPI003DA71EDD